MNNSDIRITGDYEKERFILKKIKLLSGLIAVLMAAEPPPSSQSIKPSEQIIRF